MWGSNFPTTVKERAYQSLNMSIEENNRKQIRGEDKIIRALASTDFYNALQSAASHSPVPIQLFCDYTSSMTDIAEAMRKGLDTKKHLARTPL